MTARAFDDSANRCHGDKSKVTLSLCAICLTCSRLTMKRNVPLIAGKVYRDEKGTADCKDWRAHEVTLRPNGAWGQSATHGGVVAHSEHTEGVSK